MNTLQVLLLAASAIVGYKLAEYLWMRFARKQRRMTVSIDHSDEQVVDRLIQARVESALADERARQAQEEETKALAEVGEMGIFTNEPDQVIAIFLPDGMVVDSDIDKRPSTGTEHFVLRGSTSVMERIYLTLHSLRLSRDSGRGLEGMRSFRDDIDDAAYEISKEDKYGLREGETSMGRLEDGGGA